MPDQAAHLRSLVRQAVAADAALAPGATIVTLSGAHPGIGATTAARGVAAQLASLGKQTILIEANLAHRNNGSAADGRSTAKRNAPTIAHVLSGARRAIETLIEAEDHLRILPAALAGEIVPALDANSIQRFTEELTALARHADYILIDAGHGMSAWIDRLWQLASQVLLVATPDSASILDAYAALKLAQFHRLDGRLRLLFNQCDDAADAARWSARFNDTCTRFLFITPKPHVTLATHSAGNVADANSTRAPRSHQRTEAGMRTTSQDAPFTRSARLLAADLIAEARVIKLPARVSRDAIAEPAAPASRQSPSNRGSESRVHAEASAASTRFFPTPDSRLPTPDS